MRLKYLGVRSGALIAAACLILLAAVISVSGHFLTDESGISAVVLRRLRMLLPSVKLEGVNVRLWPDRTQVHLEQWRGPLTKDVFLQVNNGDLFAEATFARIDTTRPQSFLKYLTFGVERLQVNEVFLSGVRSWFWRRAESKFFDGWVVISSVKWQKILAQELRIKMTITDSIVGIELVAAKAWGGEFRGQGRSAWRQGEMSFVADIDARGVNIGNFLRALEMDKQVAISGIFDGHIRLRWEAGQMEVLSAHFSSVGAGNLVIKDRSLAERAARSVQGANIVIENLQNYRYDIGTIMLGKDRGDLKAVIQLKGESGDRGLDVVWHDVLKTEGSTSKPEISDAEPKS